MDPTFVSVENEEKNTNKTPTKEIRNESLTDFIIRKDTTNTSASFSTELLTDEFLSEINLADDYLQADNLVPTILPNFTDNELGELVEDVAKYFITQPDDSAEHTTNPIANVESEETISNTTPAKRTRNKSSSGFESREVTSTWASFSTEVFTDEFLSEINLSDDYLQADDLVPTILPNLTDNEFDELFKDVMEDFFNQTDKPEDSTELTPPFEESRLARIWQSAAAASSPMPASSSMSGFTSDLSLLIPAPFSTPLSLFTPASFSPSTLFSTAPPLGTSTPISKAPTLFTPELPSTPASLFAPALSSTLAPLSTPAPFSMSLSTLNLASPLTTALKSEIKALQSTSTPSNLSNWATPTSVNSNSIANPPTNEITPRRKFGTTNSSTNTITARRIRSHRIPQRNALTHGIIPRRSSRLSQQFNANFYCKFCINCKPYAAQAYTHRVKNDRGIVVCPNLRVLKCEICKVSGNNAHTKRYCPKRPIVCS